MKPKDLLKKTNIFTLLLAAAAVGLVVRIADIAGIDTSAPAIRSASAVEEVKDQPPPLKDEDIKNAIRNVAAEVNKDAPAATEGPGSIQPPASPATPSPAPMERMFSDSEIEVLQDLSRRREDLDKRDQSLTQREALLKAAEQEVERKIAELNKLRGELEGLLGKQQTIQEDRINSLVKIYEGMKPKEAATIFNTLDMDVLLAVIDKMNERKSSPILAAMDPEKARLVTLKLAEQRKLPVSSPAAAPAAPMQ